MSTTEAKTYRNILNQLCIDSYRCGQTNEKVAGGDVDRAIAQLKELMLQVIGEDEPGGTNVMIAMEHASQRQRLSALLGETGGEK